MKVNIENIKFLNQLTSEVIILDKDLCIVWLNDSALNKGWVLNSNNKNNIITDQFSEETNGKLIGLLKNTVEKAVITITGRSSKLLLICLSMS